MGQNEYYSTWDAFLFIYLFIFLVSKVPCLLFAFKKFSRTLRNAIKCKYFKFFLNRKFFFFPRNSFRFSWKFGKNSEPSSVAKQLSKFPGSLFVLNDCIWEVSQTDEIFFLPFFKIFFFSAFIPSRNGKSGWNSSLTTRRIHRLMAPDTFSRVTSILWNCRCKCIGV